MIRRATHEDIGDLKTVIVKAFGHTTIHYLVESRYGKVGKKAWDEWKAQEIESFFLAHPDETLVTELKGRVVGFITYSLDPDRKVGTVLNNAVHPSFQSKGIGAKQVLHVLDIFRGKGMRLAQVTTGLGTGYRPARRMYEKCGFEPLMESATYYREL